MKGKANISISRATSNCGPDFIHICITDEASHTRIVEMEMPLKQFAQCITGLSIVGVPIEYPECEHLVRIGKSMEVKTEFLPLNYDNFDKFEEIVKPREVDGWVADREREINHHCVSKKGYSITFRRWV